MNLMSVWAFLLNKKYKAKVFLHTLINIWSNLITSSSQLINVCMIIIFSSKSSYFLTSLSISASNITEHANQEI